MQNYAPPRPTGLGARLRAMGRSLWYSGGKMTYLPWYKREGAVGCLVRWGEPERLGILLGSRVHLRPAAPERAPEVVLEVLDGLTQGVVHLSPWTVIPAPEAADD